MSGGSPAVTAVHRRRLLAARHRLSVPAGSAAEVTAAVVALHGTDPATVHLSVRARLGDSSLKSVGEELYDGSLVRMHGMRRTVFVVPVELAPVVRAASRAVTVREQRNVLKYLTAAGLGEDWLDSVNAQVLEVLAELGEATGAELAERVPRLRTAVPGPSGAPPFSIGTRLLTLLGMRGAVVRRAPRGGWTSNQFRWALAPALPEPEPAEARATLARLWLSAYGPGQLTDLQWWTGWTLTETHAALTAVGAVPVELDEGPGYALAETLDADAPDGNWAALLPALDPTPMGWKHRDWYLPDDEQRIRLHDRSGNIGPTVWWNGRVVGGWAQRRTGEVVWEPLTALDAEATAAVEAERDRLAAWLADSPVTVTPRFRTPLEREFAG
ncbi:MAG: winged helix DNA-binding domain-containing protein [Streptosporangiales bacterium]|nr:winged helix DNA-binding domain-containing protein [Streptosporangiales bacterium]